MSVHQIQANSAKAVRDQFPDAMIIRHVDPASPDWLAFDHVWDALDHPTTTTPHTPHTPYTRAAANVRDAIR